MQRAESPRYREEEAEAQKAVTPQDRAAMWPPVCRHTLPEGPRSWIWGAGGRNARRGGEDTGQEGGPVEGEDGHSPCTQHGHRLLPQGQDKESNPRKPPTPRHPARGPVTHPALGQQGEQPCEPLPEPPASVVWGPGWAGSAPSPDPLGTPEVTVPTLLQYRRKGAGDTLLSLWSAPPSNPLPGCGMTWLWHLSPLSGPPLSQPGSGQMPTDC